MGLIRRSGRDNVAIFSGSGHKEKISYCEDCLKVKILSPLKHRIYLDENGKITNPGPDANKWKQCWTCGVIVGVCIGKSLPIHSQYYRIVLQVCQELIP